MSTRARADVGIVGAGYAGMAAAVALVRRGVPVTVYEAARSLGGRARAVVRADHVLDNGQHILIGAYRETLKLIAEVGAGSSALLRLPLRWKMLPGFELRAAALPAPWHLALGLLRARGLTPAARIGCIGFVARAQRARFRIAQDGSVAELLQRHRQDPAAIACLWEPLCVAALNTPIAEASAQVFLNVLRDGLAAQRSASDLLLPKVDLGTLFPEPAAAYARARGARVLTGHTVTRIDHDGQAFSVHGPQGPVRHQALIVATQPARVPALLGHLPVLAAALAPVAAMRYLPIVTIYVQYAASPARAEPMVGLRGGHVQWLFDRGAIAGQRGLLAAVISARAREGTASHAELARDVQAEIAAIHPGLGPVKWQQVIEEKRATFACTPGLVRAPVRTPVPGLFLAGDYTEADYPATLESAVRSGLAAAAAAHETLLRA